MTEYYRPLVQFGAPPEEAKPIAGGWCWFNQVEILRRKGPSQFVAANALPANVLDNITASRGNIAGISLNEPRLMGILNVTPDSFSDGGMFAGPGSAARHALEMVKDGAGILDVGGESTRPGAAHVSIKDEIARVVPVIAEIRQKTTIPISIDTRKSTVATAAIGAGASILNDVSAFSFDPQLFDVAIKNDVPVCLMHAQGDPETMQDQPHYENVLLDVFDYLSGRIDVAVAAGISRHKIIIDVGIGFGKTPEHNLALLRGLSLFHSLGSPILLGASRKRFIGTIADVPDPLARIPGSLAVTLAGIAQGVQIHRVHDISEARQALTLWAAATGTRR